MPAASPSMKRFSMSRLRINWPVLVLGTLACLAALALHARSLCCPYLYWDDFEILLQSYTWQETRAHLWVPVNEHCWPLTRLGTWALVSAADRPRAVPWAAMVQARVVLVAGLVLLYVFVRREFAHPFHGMVALTIFGVSAAYQQAVNWFAATPALPTLCMTLLALLAAQRWRQEGRLRHLALAAGWSALAPGWYGGGILTGPLACLYLLYPPRRGRIWHCLAPLLGSVAFLAVSLPLSGKEIWHADHYGSKNAAEAFEPLTGLINTGRSVVDNVLLGAVGISGFTCPPWVVIVCLIMLTVAGVWWWRRTSDHRLFVLGLALILLNYWLIYSARAGWPYDIQLRAWSRYNVFPQLGLALIVCSGLRPAPVAEPSPALSLGQIRLLAGLILILFVVNWPRGYFGTLECDPDQARVFARVDEIDARCRAYRISAADARRVLENIDMPGGGCDNPWRFLRGSANPIPHTEAETRELLQLP